MQHNSGKNHHVSRILQNFQTEFCGIHEKSVQGSLKHYRGLFLHFRALHQAQKQAMLVLHYHSNVNPMYAKWLSEVLDSLFLFFMISLSKSLIRTTSTIKPKGNFKVKSQWNGKQEKASLSTGRRRFQSISFSFHFENLGGISTWWWYNPSS